MSVSSSWIHGNALVVESPVSFNAQGAQSGRLAVTPFGPGAQIVVEGNGDASSWIHVPIPTINWVLGRFERFELVRAFLLFECSSSSVDYIHIYDGNEKVEEFRGPNPGTYLTKSAANTFELKQPHRMKSGVGLSFYYNVGNIMDGGRPPTTLFVAAAGVEFNTGNIFVSAVSDLIFLRRR